VLVDLCISSLSNDLYYRLVVHFVIRYYRTVYAVGNQIYYKPINIATYRYPTDDATCWFMVSITSL
jgi:hypothetical protein